MIPDFPITWRGLLDWVIERRDPAVVGRLALLMFVTGACAGSLAGFFFALILATRAHYG